MPDDILAEAPAGPAAASPSEAAIDLHWRILGQLESAAIGTRIPEGPISVRRDEPAGCFLYGPYIHLPAGPYRLGFRCRSGVPQMTAQPVLGVEIIVLSRFQVEWRDFTAAELNSGEGSLDFVVTAEHSLEGVNEGRFEFRFFHFGNADLEITTVDVDALPPGMAEAQPRRWRLLGRLRKGWLGRRHDDGRVSTPRRLPAGLLLHGGWPYLRLPCGHYRLSLDLRSDPGRQARPVLGVEVFGQSYWRSRRSLMELARWPETTGALIAARELTAAEIAAGPVALDFAVPLDMALEAGSDAPFDIRLHHRGNAAVTINAVDLVRLDSVRVPAAPHLRPAGRRRIVMIGNCQAETLRQGFAQIEALNRLFDAKYHFIQLPKNLEAFAVRDLQACDIVLAQDIRLWDDFPLRDAVRPGAEIHRFPLVRFSSLWPFDAWNGPGDKLASNREGANLTFPYLDGLLARLRSEIPDREARLAAYRALDLPGIVNYRRLHQLEVRRLEALDRQYGIPIGAYTVENFQHRRIFHTTVRPNWQVYSLLMQFVAGLVGVREKLSLTERVDASLRNPQIPVHPKVARDLGVAWADEDTRYVIRAREMVWEGYVREYIQHYG